MEPHARKELFFITACMCWPVVVCERERKERGDVREAQRRERRCVTVTWL